MHTYNEDNTHELILAHQHRLQLYEVAKTKADNTRLVSEYDRKRYLDELFTQIVLVQLGGVKTELASHGYASDIVTKTAQLDTDNTVVDLIYEVTFTFSGSLQSDGTLGADDSQMVFFAPSGSHHIACRYKTAQLSSQVQTLYFDDEGYSHFLAHGGPRTLWHEYITSQSELSSMISDFISLIFIEKRGNLSRI
ncbi:hypothetical protein PSECIP111951_00943 [Pseudoalteromonas holothuriae]|uniref:Uncharacterized protein n=1 Tax=Pseudoalteromonas holothuriae TaxID=2963714 RepID=A0A9W4QW37_9GAMM|nr:MULTISPECIES: hypothetical protein [unclassified Pseudoalteromonas]CAH9054027.1 hypothetical protein PSECIP111951_00943 [Pseudoalteromonas sp. CIP111951]CAH9055593.1 hypothetical protein PSECIP111854_01609 [Pseudoalteromonas sp. CIP111854]